MPAPAWAPSTADVGGLLHARTTEVGTGETLGDFGPTTIPTGVQVASIIERAADEVVARIGSIPAGAEGTAKAAVTYLAAMNIELSFFPNQVGDDDDIYGRLEARFESLIVALVGQVKDLLVETDETGAATGMVQGGFPGLIGTSLTEGY